MNDDTECPPTARLTRTCHIWADDLLRARFLPGADVTLEDVAQFDGPLLNKPFTQPELFAAIAGLPRPAPPSQVMG